MARNPHQKKTLFARIWNTAANKSPRQRGRQRMLLCEPLEDRRLLSGITSLSGHIFQDSAKTGSYTSQAGVAGAAIQLYDTTASTFQAAVSSSSGTFSFSSLTTGDNYYAIVRSPFGYTSFTTANVSSAGQTSTLTSTTLNVGLYGISIPYGFADGIGGNAASPAKTQGNKVTTDSSGNIYVTGWFQSTVNFDPGLGVADLTATATGTGNNSIFVAKYTPQGALVWADRMGGTGDAKGYSLAVDSSGNVYTTGYFTGTAQFDPNNAGDASGELTSAGGKNAFVCMVNSSGNFGWAYSTTQSGGSSYDDEGRNILVDGSVVVVAGIYTNGINLGSSAYVSGTNVFVMDLSSGGTLDGGYGLGSYTGGNDEPCGIALSPSGGDLYITGVYQGTVYFDDPPTIFVTAVGSEDVFLADYNLASSAFAWAENIGGSGYNEPHGIAVDSSGNIYTAGYLGGAAANSSGTIYVSKTSSSGSNDWTDQLSGGTGNGCGSDIDVVPGGNIDVGGYFSGTVTFNPVFKPSGSATLTSVGSTDGFVAQFSPSEGCQWVVSAGGAYEDDEVHGISADSVGDVYATGFFEGTVSILGNSFSAQGNSSSAQNAFLIKLGPPGTAPTATIDASGANGVPLATTSSPINFTVVFNEPVVDFTSADVSLSGTAGATTKIVTSTGPTSYNVAVSGMTGPGTVTATIPSTSVSHDPYGDASVAAATSSNGDNTVTYSVPSLTLTSPTTGTYTAGVSVTIGWTAANVDVAGPTKITLGYDPDSTPFDNNVHWFEVNGVTAANGAGSYAWNTASVASGTYYLDGYMYDFATNQEYLSHIGTPIVIAAGTYGPPAFTLTGPSAGTFTAGVSVTIGWTAANIDVAGPTKITLGYDADATAFDSNEHWFEVDQVTAANGTGSYAWNTTGIAAGTYYLAGYTYDFTTGQQLLSHITTSIVIKAGVYGPPAFALTGPSAGTFTGGQCALVRGRRGHRGQRRRLLRLEHHRRGFGHLLPRWLHV